MAKTKQIKSPFPKKVYEHNAKIYQILANPKRLEILNILKTGEASAGNLAKALKISKSNVSQHLAMLRYTKVVTTRREGLNIYYNIADSKIVEPCRILKDLWDK